MGATKMTDVKATYLGVVNGESIFAINEGSYEMNVYPYSPSFCTMVIGSYQDCMERAKKTASFIPSGMVKGFSVNSIMDAFDKAMRCPVKLVDNIVMRFHPSKGGELPQEFYDVICDFSPDIFKVLESGEVVQEVCLREHLGMAVALSKIVAAWRFVSVNVHGEYLKGVDFSGLGKMAVKKTIAPEFAYLPLLDGGNDWLFRKVRGKWIFLGECWSVEQDYIESLAFSTLGQFKKDVRAFKRAIKSAVAYKSVQLKLNTPVKGSWMGVDAFNGGVGQVVTPDKGENHFLFRIALGMQENSIELSGSLGKSYFDFDAWYTCDDSRVKGKIKAGIEVEVKTPKSFGSFTSKSFRKVVLGRQRNVWYDLENKEYVKISPKQLGVFKVIKFASC